MTNLDLDRTPFVAPKPTKIFGTVDAPVYLKKRLGAEKRWNALFPRFHGFPCAFTATTL